MMLGVECVAGGPWVLVPRKSMWKLLHPALLVRNMVLSLPPSLGHGMAPGSAGALKKLSRG